MMKRVFIEVIFWILVVFSALLEEKLAGANEIKKQVGLEFNANEFKEIFEKSKKIIEVNEGVSYTSYNLCKKNKNGKIKKIYDNIAGRYVDDCEYQHINGQKQYDIEIIKKWNKKTIKYTPRKLYTICYGNTTITNENGKFVRFIKPNEKMTKKQCDLLFRDQFLIYIKRLYDNMTDKDGVNYFNKMMINEVVMMFDVVWHNGKFGSKKTCNAMINFVKYRTRAGFNRLVQSINNDLKKNKHFGNFKNRRQRYLEILSGNYF